MGNILKKPCIDLAKTRQEWVDGCSATLQRRDTVSRGERRDAVSGGGRGRGGGKPDYGTFHWKKFGRGRGSLRRRK
jgi:hypothetical protein